jgi:hypothetical protein
MVPPPAPANERRPSPSVPGHDRSGKAILQRPISLDEFWRRIGS